VLKIDAKSHVPIYVQIVDGMRAAIASGAHRPGELLPSLRELAVELHVNPNTVQKAYDVLEREGLIHSRRGLGVFVAQRGTQSAQSQAEATVRQMFEQAIQAARAANVTPERIRALFGIVLDEALKKARA
jgi:GntR family transcriptional regulator